MRAIADFQTVARHGGFNGAPGACDSYLGFVIFQRNGQLCARPAAWDPGCDTTLEESDLPTLRKRIWQWWYAV